MHIPFLLTPAGKDYLWGGTRLKSEFAKESSLPTLAETWECSTHPDGPSTVASGPYRGKTLPQVLAGRPDFIGTHPQIVEGQLPVLVKLIDARQDLSVQVHPSDDFARKYEQQDPHGKTEMWYILSATPGARLVYGFKRNLNAAQVRQSIKDNTLVRYLQQIPVRPYDVFFIEPGTVHAIGAGIVLAEVQENSNITYRLYDYDRRDKSGQPRPLHLDKALQIANLQASGLPPSPMRVIEHQPNCASELLARCKYFLVRRLLLNCPADRSLIYQTQSNSFHILLCVQGQGKMTFADTELSFKRGDCLFVPADSVALHISGNTQFLQVSC